MQYQKNEIEDFAQEWYMMYMINNKSNRHFA